MGIFEIELKQHSPMIHFQYDQEGACLRASDVKPRLDRFIREKYSYPKDKKLNYRLEIAYGKRSESGDFIKETPCRFKSTKNEPYFADIDKRQEEKEPKLIFSNDITITLRFNTFFDKDLEAKIRESINPFFAINNFGTRSNKGYGCFYPVNDIQSGQYFTMDNFEKELKKAIDKSAIYYWDSPKDQTNFYIKIFYSLLKSGINLPGNTRYPNDFIYIKPLLFYYFKKEGISWDKKFVKEKFLSDAKSDPFTSNNPKFVRALLGLASESNWWQYKEKLKMDKPVLLIENDEIDRIPSSLMFKVFNNGKFDRIYYFFNDIHEKVLNREFNFLFIKKDQIKEYKNKKNTELRLALGKDKKPLKVPDEFSPNDFLVHIKDNIAGIEYHGELTRGNKLYENTVVSGYKSNKFN
jgi:hypothetical protein